MPNIDKVVFYFANPIQDSEGIPMVGSPPESHTLTWEEVTNNIGFSLSTGEAMFTELPDPNDNHIIRVVNGFYFGSGRHGSLLAIQYLYEDGSDGWIGEILQKANSSYNIDMIVGNWIKDLSYLNITEREEWKGKPYIGVENDFVEVKIERILPDMFLSLEPKEETVSKGESVTFEFSSTDYCYGDVEYEWVYLENYIKKISVSTETKILQFQNEGTYTVKLIARNSCGQEASREATIHVLSVEELPCDIKLMPHSITIGLGETATFDAVHPYVEEGSWTFDTSMEVLEENDKRLTLKPKALGAYSISYTVKGCQDNALLYVLEELPDDEPGDIEDKEEPPPPPLPDLPPLEEDKSGLVIDLVDASKPILPLYKYPNIMKRNARYRGHRESEKVLNSHQEQIYDIRRIYKDLAYLEETKDKAIHSWFYGIEPVSNTMINKENHGNKATHGNHSSQINSNEVRGFKHDMLQLKGKSLEERIVGIHSIKKRLRELDERIAESERRYDNYENAYK